MRVWLLSVLSCCLLLSALSLPAKEFVTAAPSVIFKDGVYMAPVGPVAAFFGMANSISYSNGSISRWQLLKPGVGANETPDNPLITTIDPQGELPFIFSNTVYVPLEEMMKALGGSITVDATAKTVTASTKTAQLKMALLKYPEDCSFAMQGAGETWLANIDGSGLRRLTYDLKIKDRFAISPDGGKLVYEMNQDIVKREVDSPYSKPLPSEPLPKDSYRFRSAPGFCPDGSVIFSEYMQPVKPIEDAQSIYRVAADNSKITKIGKGSLPIMSADGKLIAYNLVTAREIEAHVMNADGTGDRKIAAGAYVSAFSPDSSLLAYVKMGQRIGAQPVSRIVIFRLSDSKEFAAPAEDKEPLREDNACFSPDGKKLVFERKGIWIMDADHANAKELTKAQADIKPLFSPDGARIYFIRTDKLMSMNPDGSDIKPVVSGIYPSSFAITPDGKHILLSALSERPARGLSYKIQDGKIYQAPTKEEIEAAKTAGARKAVISTLRGDIVLELNGTETPRTVANFIKLAKAGYYDNLTFFSITHDSVRAGSPTENGFGGPGYIFIPEISPKLKPERGSIALIFPNGANSGGGLFSITLAVHKDQAPTSPAQHPMKSQTISAVFGKVVSGLDVAEKIRISDRILKITVE